jgi:hypothetical protein
MMIKVTRYRTGRNFIRVGDHVRVKPSGRKRDGFRAVVRTIRVDEETGHVREVEVFGGAGGRAMIRTFRPDRIERLAQTHKGVHRHWSR